MRRQHGVYTDSTGAAHVTAERRYLLYELCDRLRLDRRAIRWSMDLNCHVLIVRHAKDKQTLRQLLHINLKGVKPCTQERALPPYSRSKRYADPGQAGDAERISSESAS
ncbi:hypothetical protein [Paenibacillus dendritiformis]|uniref:hypothetical protein n=1 Tax=Paenibacillus dendritiformis TaxID=130049 RepID=UPI000DA80DC2|nr:hypothetical protein [Paenibacillus dendritiformis]PZM61743.1 hypothetical protein DOE73_31030 [Paenibacillus dendritiformis]